VEGTRVKAEYAREVAEKAREHAEHAREEAAHTRSELEAQAKIIGEMRDTLRTLGPEWHKTSPPDEPKAGRDKP